MGIHVVCYVRRNIITDWKRLVVTHAEPAFVYGSNDDRVFGRYLNSGGILWVVASIPKYSPELVARIKVRKVVSSKDVSSLAILGVSSRLLRHFQQFKWIAVGEGDSEFFGHNFASDVLLRTPFVRRGGARLLDEQATQWSGHIGAMLQRPALVYTNEHPGAAFLENLAERARRSVFISWKWADNSRITIRNLAYDLAREGIVVWLDQLALPASKALDKVVSDSEVLRRLLRYGYTRCQTVLAVESKNYGIQTPGSDRNWTMDEWSGSLKRDNPPETIVYSQNGVSTGLVTSLCKRRLASRDTQSAAKELSTYLKSIELNNVPINAS